MGQTFLWGFQGLHNPDLLSYPLLHNGRNTGVLVPFVPGEQHCFGMWLDGLKYVYDSSLPS